MAHFLVPRLDSTSQSVFPKAANTVIFAPFLHHPRLELVFNGLPLVHLRRSILSLATPLFDLGFQPLNMCPQALRVEPSSEIFEHYRMIKQDLLVPRGILEIRAWRRRLDCLRNLRIDHGLYRRPFGVGGLHTAACSGTFRLRGW